MPIYRVRPGVTFGPAGCIPAGQTVTLTEYEAGGFLDKLELVSEDLVSTSSTSEETAQPDAPATTPEDGGQVLHKRSRQARPTVDKG
jgi:hypothetical protein